MVASHSCLGGIQDRSSQFFVNLIESTVPTLNAHLNRIGKVKRTINEFFIYDQPSLSSLLHGESGNKQYNFNTVLSLSKVSGPVD